MLINYVDEYLNNDSVTDGLLTVDVAYLGMAVLETQRLNLLMYRLHSNNQPTGYDRQLAAQLSVRKTTYKPSKLGQTDLILVCDQSSLVGLCLQYYKSLHVAAVICATHRDRQQPNKLKYNQLQLQNQRQL